MAQLNQMELQNLRQIIGSHEMVSQKFQAYAKQAMDTQVRDFLSSRLRTQETKQQLMNFLK